MCPFKMIWYKQKAEFEYSVFLWFLELRQFALKMEEEKMKSIILYNQGGYSPQLLAFNGETNFAILYYACTIKPSVLASKLDDDVRSDEFKEVACL